MKKYITFIVLVVILLVAPFLAKYGFSQPPPTPQVEDIPIDGGLGFLIAAGMVYGAKKLYKQKDK